VSIFEAILLGIVEGLTEFLPVSSTGHLILTREWLGIDHEAPLQQMFLFVSQTGAILAVVLYFWRDLWRRLCAFSLATWRTHLFTKLLVAFIPSAIVGLAVKGVVERHLENNAPAVAIALILGAIAIELIDRRYRQIRPMTLDDVTMRQAFLIGLAQCLSLIPGVSRSGATIMGGMVVGLTPAVSTAFSFYLGIPTLLAAGAYSFVKHREHLTTDTAGVALLGTLVAFVVALLVVELFLGYVKRYRFRPFAIYRVVLGAVVLVAWMA